MFKVDSSEKSGLKLITNELVYGHYLELYNLNFWRRIFNIRKNFFIIG